MTILIWLPLALMIAAYACSWPVVPSMGTHAAFDGAALFLAIGLPSIWLLLGTYTQTDDPAVLETRQWMPLLFPFWLTAIGTFTLTAIAIVRYFIFRRCRHSLSDAPPPQKT